MRSSELNSVLITEPPLPSSVQARKEWAGLLFESYQAPSVCFKWKLDSSSTPIVMNNEQVWPLISGLDSPLQCPSLVLLNLYVLCKSLIFYACRGLISTPRFIIHGLRRSRYDPQSADVAAQEGRRGRLQLLSRTEGAHGRCPSCKYQEIKISKSHWNIIVFPS
jgi:hypothetical protein